MMRSLFSGVAGLKTHQTRMDVIGNNIANVNTTAYKSQSMTFQDLLYQTTQNASAANANTGAGGINARQIGLGAKTGAISTAITQQGSAQSTSNPFDIMITGDSFFVVSNGSDNFFTRDGSFCVDGVGNLVMSSTGYTVMGWQSDKDGNIVQDKVSPLRIMSAENMVYPPEATSLAYVTGIVDKNDIQVSSSSGRVIGLSFYDNLGYQYNARFSIHELYDNNGNANGEFFIQLDKILDSTGEEVQGTGAAFGTTLNYTDYDTINKLDASAGYVLESYTDTDDTTKYKIVKVTKNTDGTETRTDVDLTNQDDIATAYGGLKEEDGTTNKYDSWTFDSTTGKLNVTKNRTASNAAYVTFDTDSGMFKGAGTKNTGLTADDSTLQLTFDVNQGQFSPITIDFSTTTMFNNNGTSTVGAVNGNVAGLIIRQLPPRLY